MHSLEKMGGVAVLIEAATFTVGFVMFATVLADLANGDLDPVQTVAFLWRKMGPSCTCGI